MKYGDNIIDFKNDNNPQVVPKRLKDARIYRELSQKELSESVGITTQALSYYERGDRVVKSDILIKLAQVLDFPLGFFYKEKRCKESTTQGDILYFRSSNLSAKRKDMLEMKLECLTDEVVSFIEHFIHLPEVNLIRVDCKERYTKKEIQSIARALRELWGLGKRPIKDIAHVMQQNGCIIGLMDTVVDKTDGYSKWDGIRPYTFLNLGKESAVRARFTLGHELGHLILHRNLKPAENIKIRENEAHYFANEFIYPSEVALEEIYSVTLESLIPIKNKWGISIVALIQKCLDLNLIGEERYTMLQKQISAKKWRKQEPLDDVIKFREPKLLAEAFDLMIKNQLVTKNELVDNIALSQSELTKICCLRNDFFEEESIVLKPILRVLETKRAK